jgi:hypothetical protein
MFLKFPPAALSPKRPASPRHKPFRCSIFHDSFKPLKRRPEGTILKDDGPRANTKNSLDCHFKGSSFLGAPTRPVSAFSPFPVRNLLFLWTATCGFQPSKGNEKSHYILNIFPFLTKRKECKDDSSKESEGMHQSKQASEPRSSNPCLLDLSFAYTVKVTRQGRAVMHLSH